MDCLKLKLWVVVSYLTWVLESKPALCVSSKFSCVLSISPASPFQLLLGGMHSTA